MVEINLLYPGKQGGKARSYGFASDLIKDLNLSVILEAMAGRDEFIYQSCKAIMMNLISDVEVLKFRQQMVNDAINNEEFYEELYRLAGAAVESVEKNKGKGKQGTREQSKTQQIYSSLQLLLIEVKYLEKVKDIMRSDAAERSSGMMAFSQNLKELCSDEFVQIMQELVDSMAFLLRGGRIVVTAGVGGGMKCSDGVVSQLEPFDVQKKSRILSLLQKWVRFLSSVCIVLRDTACVQEAAQMETNALHYLLECFQKLIVELQDFFEQLKYQISFYVGCARLHHKMEQLHMRVTFPKVCQGTDKMDAQDLYELSMALTTLRTPVPNSISDDCHLHIISGANQGGKSTFLRSVGIAQVMMQAGLFVPAAYYASPLYDMILTHFTRREDSSMNSGRLVEEMKRMNHMVNMVSAKSLILMNESFSSTTEKEGSLVADSIIRALFDSGVTVWMVTHLYEFASRLYQRGAPGMRFMCADRREDGSRTFKILDGEPQETSYGMDLYQEIVGTL